MTNSKVLLQELASFDVASYVEAAHRDGRCRIAEDLELRTKVRRLALNLELLEDSGVAFPERSTRNSINISRLFFDAQNYVLSNERPRYEPYATILLLRYVLGVDSHEALSVTQSRIWTVFRQIIQVQLDFEMESIAGISKFVKKDFSSDVSRARCAVLSEVRDLIPSRYFLTTARNIVNSRSLLDVARDSVDSVVAQMLVFPQTACHDEVAFIRLIHMSECMFWGVLICVQRALTAVHVGQLGQALQLTDAATEFAAPLIKIFRAVRTMPPEHFLGFRDATGDASAIQCQSWQLLDAHMYGVLPEKIEVLTTIPEVRHVLRLANPDFISLVQISGQLGESELEASLHESIIKLDHRLRAWRKYHEKQLAGRTDPGYLPPEARGTGGTSGYGYLAAHEPPRASKVPANRAKALSLRPRQDNDGWNA